MDTKQVGNGNKNVNGDWNHNGNENWYMKGKEKRLVLGPTTRSETRTRTVQVRLS